ncbi:unnamed protein product [Rotaria sordida]|uniref:Uncharacterized protein n=1 Tax=Rotaria sordida TaxID=392033 RepID=A0A814TFE5_9BILA|nr:unnamed protein product [Rotaria sordida]
MVIAAANHSSMSQSPAKKTFFHDFRNIIVVKPAVAIQDVNGKSILDRLLNKRDTCLPAGVQGCFTGGTTICCSGYCDYPNGICCNSLAQACTSDSECCTGYHCEGTCVRNCLATGQACGGNPCCSGYCDYPSNVCCLDLGKACTGGGQCCSRYSCDGGICR